MKRAFSPVVLTPGVCYEARYKTGATMWFRFNKTNFDYMYYRYYDESIIEPYDGNVIWRSGGGISTIERYLKSGHISSIYTLDTEEEALMFLSIAE